MTSRPHLAMLLTDGRLLQVPGPSRGTTTVFVAVVSLLTILCRSTTVDCFLMFFYFTIYFIICIILFFSKNCF